MTDGSVSTLWLIGMMGSGKTSVGRMVAARTGRIFIDTDAEIVELSGSTIPDLWARNGEEGFRDTEAEVVSRIDDTGAVVAAGGGVVLRDENVLEMRKGLVIWLKAAPGELARRIGGGGGRPLLVGGEEPEILTKILGQREGGYSAASHHSVDTDGRTIEEVAMEVIAIWNRS